jgi:endonuclease/exonuclease/phosphatase (EEP) superfamily protein YafD
MTSILSRYVSAFILVGLMHGFAFADGGSDRVGLIKYNSVSTPTARPGDTLKFFIWNVAKYDDPESVRAVTRYSQLADFVLIEESMMGGTYADFYKSLSGLNWYSAASFEKNQGEWTGVTTGTRLAVSGAFGIRSNGREPFLHTPKMIVITEHPIVGRTDKLWVVNIHGINFVDASVYVTQINQLEKALATHQGPIVLAGDFNLWSVDRALIVNAMATRIGLHYVPLKDDYRTGIPFDHIFTRGMTTVATEYMNGQGGSDHKPMWGEFKIEN